MRATLPRLLSTTRAARSLLGSSAPPPPSGAACTGAPVGPNNATLPPVRYHIFKNKLPYPTGLKLQSAILDARFKARETGGGKTDSLFLLEHTPTYTTGRRDNTPNPDQLHPEEKKVQNVGAGFYITKRGGQVTYHGPGQIVGYGMFDLNAMGTPTRCYVEYLQALLGEYVRDQGVDAYAPHPDDHVGVFPTLTSKVASIGIHLRHRVTSHGFAMNITPEPIAWFDLVTACGLDDVSAVSLHQLLQALPTPPASLPSVLEASQALVPRFADTFQREFVELGAGAQDGEVAGDVEAIREIVAEVEAEAAQAEKEAGGWPTAPRTA